MAALLHDVIEDSSTVNKASTSPREFGDEPVAEIVDGVSRS